ncbi:hypothetical protein SASPL_108602 [Salvia splendens]|uniref:Myb/SANT-like domain-containing protein n=1 Tax=Salvia splendens TaxID=180675 RepID=A0A8X9A5I8_SALSN|nr:hypothetical protein SASPL_108602 [Salvia splendens]
MALTGVLAPTVRLHSSDYRRNRSASNNRSRRSWSDTEEATLVIALKDLVVSGWKSDNGFKGGYLTRIEEAMKRDFPKTDLKATPHISSKIST